MKINNRFLIIIVFILVGLTVIIVTTQIDISNVEKMRREYPDIQKESRIEGIISSIYDPPRIRVSADLLSLGLTNGSKFTVGVSGDAINNNFSIRDVSMVGALFKKEAGSDTVEIIYKEEVYRFLIYRDD